jgi:predicted nucleic acid-binding protein
VVVLDTGPLLHLSEAQALDLLALTGEVHIPKAVDLEVKQQLNQRNWRPKWVHVDLLTHPYNTEATAWQQAGLLDVGEAGAIALARQIHAHWLLTDDAAARLLAQSLGFEVHGSLGITVWAVAVGHLQHAEAGSILDRLARSSLWISERVLDEAKVALSKLKG